MIYGDPFDFSIQFDIVENWTDPTCFWKNGVFCMFIDGRRMLDIVDVVELKVAVNFYAKMKFGSVVNGDPEIPASDLFKSAHSHFFGGDKSCVPGVQDMTCTFLGDSGVFIYFQKTEKSDRLVWSYDFGKTVYEKLLSVGVVIDVVESVLEL